MPVLQRMLVPRCSLIAGIAALVASPAVHEAAARADEDVPSDFARLVLDTGRVATAPAEPGVVRKQGAA